MMLRIYIAAAILAALAGAWGLSLRQAYNSGHSAATAAQAQADAQQFREIIKEYNDATDSPISDAAADCLLRRLGGIGESEDCGDL